MQYLSSVARWAVAATEGVADAGGAICAGNVTAEKKTAPANARVVDDSARVRSIGRSLPPPKTTHLARAGYTQRLPRYKGPAYRQEDAGSLPLEAVNVASISARSSSVTSGSIPHRACQAGGAWCSSIPSPSTVGLPRRRAAASSGVSSGTYTMPQTRAMVDSASSITSSGD